MEQAENPNAGLGALASVLARDINDIADLPSYVAPPPGVYKLQIDKVEQKEIKKKTTLVVEYVILGNLSLSDPTAEDHQARLAAIKEGDRMSEAFYFDKPENIEQTLSVLKAKFGGLSQMLGTTNLLEIMTKLPEVKPVIQAQITNRVDDSDSTRFYASTRNIVPAV